MKIKIGEIVEIGEIGEGMGDTGVIIN